MRILLIDIARAADITTVTLSNWLVKLPFKKKSVGRGFTPRETKQLCNFLDLEYETILEFRKIRSEQVSKVRRNQITADNSHNNRKKH